MSCVHDNGVTRPAAFTSMFSRRRYGKQPYNRKFLLLVYCVSSERIARLENDHGEYRRRLPSLLYFSSPGWMGRDLFSF